MDDISLAVQNMYNKVGGYFSKTREKSYGKNSNWPETQEFLERVRPGQSVLDIGCGEGRLLTGLADEVEYLGVDFSSTLIEIARKKYPSREFRLGDIAEPATWEELGRYDYVCSVATLHHVPTRERQLYVLKMMKEKCQDEGQLFLTTWNLYNERLSEKKLKEHELVSGEIVELSFDSTPGRYVMAMDMAYVEELVADAGWEIEEIYYADRVGKRVDEEVGKNLVVVASVQ